MQGESTVDVEAYRRTKNKNRIKKSKQVWHKVESRGVRIVKEESECNNHH